VQYRLPNVLPIAPWLLQEQLGAQHMGKHTAKGSEQLCFCQQCRRLQERHHHVIPKHLQLGDYVMMTLLQSPTLLAKATPAHDSSNTSVNHN
jgi:hypothetical protein